MKKVTLELWYGDETPTDMLKQAVEENKIGWITDEWVYLKGRIEEKVRKPDEADSVSG